MSTRLDRRSALRRAAAPSVDLSLLPDTGALQALLDAANRTSTREDPSAVSQAEARRSRVTGGGPTAVPADPERPAAPNTLDVPEPAGLEVPERFRMKVRPKDHPTLQPHDAPIARGLDRARAKEDAAAAAAFVESHAPAPEPQAGPQRLGDLPTLIHFGRADTQEQPAPSSVPRPPTPGAPAAQPAEDVQDDLPHPTPVSARKREPRAVARTLRPRESARSGSGVTLTPTAEEKLFWDSAEDHVDEVPLWACADEDASLAEEVDPELDRWMASRGRRRFLAATGVAAVMLLTVAFAALGVAVMAQPALIGGSQAAQEMPLERPPPPRPVTPGR